MAKSYKISVHSFMKTDYMFLLEKLPKSKPNKNQNLLTNMKPALSASTWVSGFHHGAPTHVGSVGALNLQKLS